MLETDAHPTDVIAMNLTMAAMESWLRTPAAADRTGEEIGREVAAMYREIHAAVDEMSPEEPEDDFFDEDDDEDEEDEELEHD